MAKKILIDTDCGIDDAIAIMMALAANEVEVIGITTVSGNVRLVNVIDNVLRLLSYLDKKDIPVYRGASGALVEKAVRAEGPHGKNGLGDLKLPAPRVSLQDAMAPEGIYRHAKADPGLTVVTLGPMTNLAIAVNLYPELKSLIAEIVVMGGAIGRGNVTAFAEFNFYADPESVQFILDSSIPLHLIPWDACVASSYSEAELLALGMSGNRAGDLFLDLIKVPIDYMERFTGMRTLALADPAAMAYAIDPGATLRKISGGLMMELNRSTLRGASVYHGEGSIPIVMEMQKERFTELLLAIKHL
ncbi:MAG: nucleoside hydrolase [Spirochaetota bacterium]